MSFKNTFGAHSSSEVESFVQISCDGEIRYEINEPYAIFFKKSNDDGKIKAVTENTIEFKSWIGLSWKDFYNGPTKKEDGCYELSFKGKRFVTSQITDCSKPPPTLSEAFESTLNYYKSGGKNKCY